MVQDGRITLQYVGYRPRQAPFPDAQAWMDTAGPMAGMAGYGFDTDPTALAPMIQAVAWDSTPFTVRVGTITVRPAPDQAYDATGPTATSYGLVGA